MTDEAALLTAVAAAPDDDLPRLVFADWLDEHGQPDRAEFVRAQVRLAAADPWDEFAVLCRHRRTDWLRGDRWWETLPEVDPGGVQWHPDYAFRRGFGWSLLVRDVDYLLDVGPRLFAAAPVGELHLPGSWPLDMWRRFAAAPWLPRVRSVHFYGTTTPIEPVRELRAAPLATGIEEIVFQSASGAGMPDVLGDLMRSPLGRRVTRLGLHVGPDDPSELLSELEDATAGGRLEHLSVATFTRPFPGMDQLYRAPGLRRLRGLELANIPRAEPPWVFDRGYGAHLTRLRVSNCESSLYVVPAGELNELRALDLSNNPIGPWAEEYTRPAHRSRLFGVPGLRALVLRKTQFRDDLLRFWLTHTAFWPNLTELDLRDNRITDAGAEHLLAAVPPPGLTALLLGGNPISDAMWGRLRDRFGDALIPPEEREITGL